MAPGTKQLYSSDTWGPSELHLLGALLWRRGISRVAGRWVQEGEWAVHDAERVLRMLGHENARRVCQLQAAAGAPAERYAAGAFTGCPPG